MMHALLARRVLALAAALSTAQVAEAGTVTHHFRGTVDFVTDGTLGSIDLTGSFSIGQTLQLTMTVERSTPASAQDPITALYHNSVTQFGFTLGTYVCTGAGFDDSEVWNDRPPPVPSHATDEYLVGLGNLTA